MTRPITPRLHGILDYATVAAFLNAPLVLGFTGTAAATLYWLAGIHLLMTGCTNFPYGMFKIIPFRLHGAIDLIASLFLVAAPWLLGFADNPTPRNFFVVMGVTGLAIVALTDYTPTVRVPPPAPGDRRRWRAPAGTE